MVTKEELMAQIEFDHVVLASCSKFDFSEPVRILDVAKAVAVALDVNVSRDLHKAIAAHMKRRDIINYKSRGVWVFRHVDQFQKHRKATGQKISEKMKRYHTALKKAHEVVANG